MTAIENGGDPRTLNERLNQLTADRAAVAARAPQPISDATLDLHPNAARLYREEVLQIQKALGANTDASREVMTRVRNLVQQIVVRASGKGFELEIVGNLAAMLDGAAEPNTNGRTVLMVAGGGLEPPT